MTFSITAEGTIFHNGQEIGTIEHTGEFSRGKVQNFTVRPLTRETADGDMLFMTSIGSGSGVTEIVDPQ